MKYIYKKITLDVHNMTSQLSLAAKQGATLRGIIVTLVADGKIYEIPDKCYAVFSAKNSDGDFFVDDCVIQDNKILYNFSENLVASKGKMDCDITLYGSNGERLTSPRFYVFVYETVKGEYASGLTTSDEFATLNALIDDTKKTLSEASAVVETADNIIERANEATEFANESAQLARATITHIQPTADGKLQLLDADMNVVATVDVFCGDDDTLYRYEDGMLSVVGIKERNNDNTFRVWVGTNEEYNALETIDPTTFYWITDDMTYEEVVTKVNNLIESCAKMESDLRTGTFVVNTAVTAESTPHAIEADKLKAFTEPPQPVPARLTEAGWYYFWIKIIKVLNQTDGTTQTTVYSLGTTYWDGESFTNAPIIPVNANRVMFVRIAADGEIKGYVADQDTWDPIPGDVGIINLDSIYYAKL